MTEPAAPHIRCLEWVTSRISRHGSTRDIARASRHEIEAILDLALALDYFRPEELAKLQATREECAKTVYGLLRKLSDGSKQPVS